MGPKIEYYFYIHSIMTNIAELREEDIVGKLTNEVDSMSTRMADLETKYRALKLQIHECEDNEIESDDKDMIGHLRELLNLANMVPGESHECAGVNIKLKYNSISVNCGDWGVKIGWGTNRIGKICFTRIAPVFTVGLFRDIEGPIMRYNIVTSDHMIFEGVVGDTKDRGDMKGGHIMFKDGSKLVIGEPLITVEQRNKNITILCQDKCAMFEIGDIKFKYCDGRIFSVS
jgi:hypothetical protein